MPIDRHNTRPRSRWLRRRSVFWASLLVLMMIAASCADRLILHPSTHSIPAPGASRALIPVTNVGDIEVYSARTSSAEPRAFVLVFMGNADRAERGVYYGLEEAGGRDVEVWAMNYCGFGGSTGASRLKNVAPAALATYDAMRAKAGDRPIFISAGSLGTAAALCVAARRQVAGMILSNPPPLRQLIFQRHGWWNLWLLATPIALQVPRDLDSIANARVATAPAVLVLAGADEIVPPAYQMKVADAYAGPKRLVHAPIANHNDPVSGDAAIQARAAMEWMWQSGLAGASRNTTRPKPID